MLYHIYALVLASTGHPTTGYLVISICCTTSMHTGHPTLDFSDLMLYYIHPLASTGHPSTGYLVISCEYCCTSIHWVYLVISCEYCYTTSMHWVLASTGHPTTGYLVISCEY
ncbi:hypothetical protein CEXT_717081 [Caerostris extrusa]|uniref:Uncharacterized protein n=1 Tax=Caerostris extrusa TaxID=172846 RepID=A0AAV4WNR4_CAEEX|nr:hypothetical protein CEXT_717081 [Caerostris extrusa]